MSSETEKMTAEPEQVNAETEQMAEDMFYIGDMETLVTIHWNVGDIFSLSDQQGDYCTSPLFSFANSYWYLELYPSGMSESTSSEWVSLVLKRDHHSDSSQTLPLEFVRLTFGIKGPDGVQEKRETEGKLFLGRGISDCWSKADLMTLQTDDGLTITCELRSDLDVVKAISDHKSIFYGNITLMQSIYRLKKNDGRLRKEVESQMELIKTLQKMVENYKLGSEKYKKQIKASESEKFSIKTRYNCLLKEQIAIVSRLEKDNEQLRKEVESLIEQTECLQKTVKNFELESEYYEKQISTLKKAKSKKVEFGILLFIIFEILCIVFVF